jgi:hypothetical protein
MDFKAPAATYLRIINVWNVAKFSFLDVHGTANAQGEVPTSLRLAAWTFSTACNKEVARLAAYPSWPSSVTPLITKLAAQKVIMADTLHQLSATKSTHLWNALMLRSVAADNEGRRLSGLIRAALGLPAQATTNKVPEVV